jgi:hypothetical protein
MAIDIKNVLTSEDITGNTGFATNYERLLSINNYEFASNIIARRLLDLYLNQEEEKSIQKAI